MIGQKLSEIYNYYLITRNVGHTTLMKEGTDNFKKDKLVLCVDVKHGHNMKIKPSEMVTLHSLDRLRSCNKPLVMDNYTLITIFELMLSKYDKLTNDVFNAQEKTFKVEKQVSDMKSQPFKTFFRTIFKLH